MLLKVKPFLIFGLNVLLMAVSVAFRVMPQGDEYLALFLIPLVIIVAPFVIKGIPLLALLLLNVVFFVFYSFAGSLDTIDIMVLSFLLATIAGASLTVRHLNETFSSYYEKDILEKQREYNGIVTELEGVDRRGRKIEGELSSISRLYEITKRLAPALRLESLLNALYDFLQENFSFESIHLLTFARGEFVRGMSKSSEEETISPTARGASESGLPNYEKIVECSRERELTSCFIDKEESAKLFASLGVNSSTLAVFPLFMGATLCAILAVEGASRSSYGRMRLLAPQIGLELRKVELYEQVQELSIIDGLTEVYLRRYLMDRLKEEVDRAGRLGLTFSVGMIDVDNFKQCNDKFGHLVGDAVLKVISSKLKKSVREVDMVARYGGEEFCVVLPETTKEIAFQVAERLRQSVGDKVIKAFDEEIKMTVSVGISTYPEDAKDVESLIDKADGALYSAKRKGRNTVCGA